jgi:hypothetical protein
VSLLASIFICRSFMKIQRKGAKMQRRKEGQGLLEREASLPSFAPLHLCAFALNFSFRI